MIPNNEWKNDLSNVIKYLQSIMLQRIRRLSNPAFKQELRKSRSLCKGIPQYKAHIISDNLAGPCAKGFPVQSTHNI